MILPYKTGTAVRVASPHGYRVDPITGEPGVPHNGIDLVSNGDKTVVAVVNGVVLRSRMVTDRSNRTWEWGNYVSVIGDDGFTYYYCHLASRLVTAGERVEVGRALGIEGSTGRSTGSHLHFEVRNASGTSIDPTEILSIVNSVGAVRAVDETEEQEEVTMDDEKKTTDSVPNEWARDAVEWAVENGIIYGTGDGDLKLRGNCTREQMLVFLYRFAQSIGKA